MPTQTITEIPTGTWSADAAHSRIEFAVDYMTGTFRGTFSPFAATLDIDPDAGVVLRGSANAADVKVQDENLEAHLQSPDFFDAERAPKLTFESKDVELHGDRVTVTGTLAIRGVEQPLRLEGTLAAPITDPFGRERVGVKLEGTLDRTAFGIDWNNPLPTGEPALANDVRVSAELYLVKA
jgi:polyisoprenoid-binding protein YceI